MDSRRGHYEGNQWRRRARPILLAPTALGLLSRAKGSHSAGGRRGPYTASHGEQARLATREGGRYPLGLGAKLAVSASKAPFSVLTAPDERRVRARLLQAVYVAMADFRRHCRRFSTIGSVVRSTLRAGKGRS